ncbi:MAG: hypothetical protein Q7S02_04410 [bacterium]|nr:hypothetical protein [bacterium]
MTIIREVHHRGDGMSHCVIRTDTYASSVAHFQLLLEEARRDFPALEPKDAEVIHYAGRRYSGTFGIEFDAATSTIPATYIEIAEVELKR